MSYVIIKGGTTLVDADGDLYVDVYGDDKGRPMLFAHRIDAEDYADWLDEAVELFVIEAPEGLDGIEMLS